MPDVLTAAELAAALEPVVRRIIRDELRLVGLRPPTPAGPGVWAWDAATDSWRALVESPAPPQSAPGA